MSGGSSRATLRRGARGSVTRTALVAGAVAHDLAAGQAQWLQTNADYAIIIEGHADERGTREYNLSLGQRRSVAVKKSLNLLGVQDSQIEAVSFGKEKPADPGHDEASWAKNRRADIAYQNK